MELGLFLWPRLWGSARQLSPKLLALQVALGDDQGIAQLFQVVCVVSLIIKM